MAKCVSGSTSLAYTEATTTEIVPKATAVQDCTQGTTPANEPAIDDIELIVADQRYPATSTSLSKRIYGTGVPKGLIPAHE